MFGSDRDTLRRLYCQAWSKSGRGAALEPLEQAIATVVREHPEYQPVLEDEAGALAHDFPPEAGLANPFLHMGMHLALREQLSTDRPAGILAVFQKLAARTGAHDAEHRMMECLGQALWQAQRDRVAPDEHAYLECLWRL